MHSPGAKRASLNTQGTVSLRRCGKTPEAGATRGQIIKEHACYAQFDPVGSWEICNILNYIVISRKEAMCRNVRSDVTPSSTWHLDEVLWWPLPTFPFRTETRSRRRGPGLETGRDGGGKEKSCFLGVPNISFISDLLSLLILEFEKFTFYKAEKNLVITILGVPKVRCIILSVFSLSLT